MCPETNPYACMQASKLGHGRGNGSAAELPRLVHGPQCKTVPCDLCRISDAVLTVEHGAVHGIVLCSRLAFFGGVGTRHDL